MSFDETDIVQKAFKDGIVEPKQKGGGWGGSANFNQIQNQLQQKQKVENNKVQFRLDEIRMASNGKKGGPQNVVI